MPFLQFKGKTAIECYHHTIPHHTIEFDEYLSLLGKGVNPNLDGNLIIEGDNLLALKALLPTHAGRIKCIYIDPPYNTGNEGWVYNDNLTQPQFKEWIGQVVGKEGEDATRHDKWCCMIYPRLQLLKQLLRDDGAIFISIDDNEVHHLRLIMDELFGEQNFVATIAWQKKFSRQSDAKWFSDTFEYILVYARNKTIWKPNLLPRTEVQDVRYKNLDDDPRGPYSPDNLVVKTYSEEYDYPIKTPTGRVVKPPTGFCWRLPKARFEELKTDNRIWFGADGNNVPRLKRFLSEVQQGLVPITLWLRDFAGDTQESVREVKGILGTEKFDSPKPVKLLRRILETATDKDSIVLDSFAGSGTTGHAVLELNKEDKGDRKFILVQLPYDSKEDEDKRFNICESITRERVARVISGYTYKNQQDKKEKIDGIGGAFTFAKVGSPILGEYKDWGKKPPKYEELAKYIFYTETSRDFDAKKINTKTGKIGENGDASYYLLYSTDHKDGMSLNLGWLNGISKSEKNRNIVVYCEKIWVHRDDLEKFQREMKKSVRPMQVPFNLK